MMKKSLLAVCIFFVLLALAINVDAFGITAFYYPGNPLTLSPGETKTVSYGFQNMVGDKNLTVVTEITAGQDIARLTDPDAEYFIPLGTSNNLGFTVIVTAPATAQLGDTYNVGVTVTTVTSGEGSGVVMGSSIGETLPVIIVSPTGTTEKPGMPTELIILIVLIAIALIILIIALFFLKKKKKN